MVVVTMVVVMRRCGKRGSSENQDQKHSSK
jgi:hypothetical protein